MTAFGSTAENVAPDRDMAAPARPAAKASEATPFFGRLCAGRRPHRSTDFFRFPDRPAFQPGIARLAVRPDRRHGEEALDAGVVVIAEPRERPELQDVDAAVAVITSSLICTPMTWPITT